MLCSIEKEEGTCCLGCIYCKSGSREHSPMLNHCLIQHLNNHRQALPGQLRGRQQGEARDITEIVGKGQ